MLNGVDYMMPNLGRTQTANTGEYQAPDGCRLTWRIGDGGRGEITAYDAAGVRQWVLSGEIASRFSREKAAFQQEHQPIQLAFGALL